MRETGMRAEELAVRALQKNGYKILDRNFSSYYGEIDIIASKEEYLVFVEVKYRKSESFGGGAAAVDTRKQERIRKTATMYLRKYETEPFVRFDVVTITGTLGFLKKPEITIIENAFY